MKRLHAGLLTLLLLACPLLGQTVTLPKEVTGEPGLFLRVPATSDGKEVRWLALDAGLSVFPSDLLRDSKTTVIVAQRPGRYRLAAWSAKGDVPGEAAITTIVIGNVPEPPPGPGPGPNPPGPNPDPAPQPSEGKWLMVVYETMDTLPQGQSGILTSTKVRQYLREKLKKEGGLKDGEFVIWDKDTDPSGYPKEWTERFTRGKAGKLPRLLISNGKTLTDVELPKDVDAFLELAKKQLDGAPAKPVTPGEGQR